MSTRTEVTVDEGVSGEEVLGLFGRFEPLHLPLSSSRRLMRVLGPIVQISALSVLDAAKQLTLSDAMAPQLLGHGTYCKPFRSCLKKRFMALASRRA